MSRESKLPTPIAFDPETLRYYRDAAPIYKASGVEGQNRFLSRFMSQLPCAARVLDIGCGGGIDARAMLDNGFSVDAIDASETIAAITSQRLGIDVEVKLFEEIDALQVYDATWASASLIHIPRPALPVVLGRVFNALKPGGLHYATFKSGGCEGRDMAGRYYNYPTETELREFYSASAPWEIDRTEEYVGGGFDHGSGPWILIEARRPFSQNAEDR